MDKSLLNSCFKRRYTLIKKVGFQGSFLFRINQAAIFGSYLRPMVTVGNAGWAS